MTQNRNHSADEVPGLTASTARRIFLVRHGVTEWNKSFRYQGAADVPLSEEGRLQALLTARRFAKVPVDVIFSSPLSRALETASLIRSETNVTGVDCVETLREVNFGDWEGLTVREIVARFGWDAFDAWRNSQITETATNGEDASAVLARAKEAAGFLCGVTAENIVVVAHGAIFRALLLYLLDIPVCNIFWRMRMDNCSITQINVDKRGVRSISYFNDSLHLQVPEKEIENLPL